MRCAAIVTLSGALSGVYLLVPAALAAPTEPETLLVPLDPAGTCLDCHAFPNPVDREDEPAFAPVLWQGSMMANAARDPVFWAAVAIADQDAPGQTIDCIRCHAPKAFLEGRGDATQMDALLPDDLDGVSCDLCHRLVDDGATPAGNARYTVDDLVGVKGVPRRGPWTYGPRDLAPSHDWAGPDPHIASSRSCGTCHDVTTEAERVDEDGNGLGVGFGEQRTYSEWLGSAFAAPGEDFRSCQDCHMPAVADV
ncbi:MAG: multiheme c-type cytochrome, partial [Myxococcota bacterium]